MSKIKAEYIWMDGHEQTQKLRSKTKVFDGPLNTTAQQPLKPLQLCALYH